MHIYKCRIVDQIFTSSRIFRDKLNPNIQIYLYIGIKEKNFHFEY